MHCFQDSQDSNLCKATAEDRSSPQRQQLRYLLCQQSEGHTGLSCWFGVRVNHCKNIQGGVLGAKENRNRLVKRVQCIVFPLMCTVIVTSSYATQCQTSYSKGHVHAQPP